jgi:hypothetical protein
MIRLNSGEAVEIGLKDFAAQGIVDELSFPLSVDQTGVFQLFHVVRERCGTNRETASDIAAGTRSITPSDLLKNLVAARIGKRAGDESELTGGEGG